MEKNGTGGGPRGVTSQKTQDTLSILREEIKKREEAMDRDSKMRKMAQLQLSVTQDSKNRAPILAQIENWEQNLEIMQCDLYRLVKLSILFSEVMQLLKGSMYKLMQNIFDRCIFAVKYWKKSKIDR